MDPHRAAWLLEQRRHEFDQVQYQKIATHLARMAQMPSDKLDFADTSEPRYRRFVENSHRRGYGGKFAPKQSTTVTPQNLATAIQRLDEGEYIDIPGGKGKVKRLKNGYQVVAGNGTLNKVFKDIGDAVRNAQRITRGRVGKRAGSKDTTRYGGS